MKLATLLLFVFSVAPLSASQLIYTFTFTASGTFDDSQFTNSPVTVTFVTNLNESTSPLTGTIQEGSLIDNLAPSRVLIGCTGDPTCISVGQLFDNFDWHFNTPGYPSQGEAFSTRTADVEYFSGFFVLVQDLQPGHHYGVDFTSMTDAAVRADVTTPEPSSFALLGLGLVGLAAWRRQK